MKVFLEFLAMVGDVNFNVNIADLMTMAKKATARYTPLNMLTDRRSLSISMEE